MYNRVLVLDDSEIDLYVSQRLIEKYCFAKEVILIESAREALKFLHSNADNESELPDLIFVDINMPEMSGFQFLESFSILPNSVQEKCAIVMLTTSVHPADQEKAERNPQVTAYITKPLSEDKLSEVKNATPHLT